MPDKDVPARPRRLHARKYMGNITASRTSLLGCFDDRIGVNLRANEKPRFHRGLRPKTLEASSASQASSLWPVHCITPRNFSHGPTAS